MRVDRVWGGVFALVLAGCYPEVPYKAGALDSGAGGNDGLSGDGGADDGGNDGSDGGSEGGSEGADGGTSDCAFFLDGDLDGYGAGDAVFAPCDSPPPGYVDNDLDCDDAANVVFPGAGERCDAVDNDCDGSIDEDLVYLWFADADADGFGDPDAVQETCEPVGRVVAEAGDCDDAAPSVNPDGLEVCGGLDEDCDGLIDDLDDSLDLSSAPVWFADGDRDGFGDPEASAAACASPAGFVADATDCDDARADVNPDGVEVCAEGDEDCDGLSGDADPSLDPSTTVSVYADADLDGFGAAATGTLACAPGPGEVLDSTDCDDSAPDVYPGAAEVCDGRDNDCDLRIDDADDDVLESSTTAYYLDLDEDGFGAGAPVNACAAPAGRVSSAGDCDDGDGNRSPAAAEVCNGQDDDCDGAADDADPSVDVSTGFTFYTDGDGDTFGDAARPVQACALPAGASVNDDDCDDASAALSPAAAEVCDTIDNNCDGRTDDADPGLLLSSATAFYADLDLDGYGGGAALLRCIAPTGALTIGGDCDESDPSVNPGASEVCNGVDDDCDGLADLADPSLDGTTLSLVYRDVDGDGYGDPGTLARACDVSAGFVLNSGDCDDSRVRVNPAASEECNGRDDDCDGLIDDADSSVDLSTGARWWVDADTDGLGAAGSVAVPGCSAPSGYVDNDLDCDDSGFTDLDADLLQDCEDEDDDGDGLRDVWDADPLDETVARGPTAGLGVDGAVALPSAGALAVTRTRLDGRADAGDDEIEVLSAAGISVGDELLILDQQGVGVGTYQFVYVAAVDGTDLTIEPPLFDDFPATDVVLVQVVPHYTSMTLSGAYTVGPWAGSGGGVYVARATGAISVSGTLSADRAGYRGASGVVGNATDPQLGEGSTSPSYTATWPSALPSTGNTNGGGALPAFENAATGGGGGGHGGAGTVGTSFYFGGAAGSGGGIAVGDATLSGWYFGGGGGAGQPDSEGDGAFTNNTTGSGGQGGGIVALYSGSGITVGGSVTAAGGNGSNASWGGTSTIGRRGELGGGGGGAGGQVLLVAPSVTVSGTLRALGGSGGTAVQNCCGWATGSPASGGYGGDGRVRVEVLSTFSGTSSPTASVGAYEP